MFCKNCGTRQTDDARFCENCGSPLDAATYGIRDLTAKRRPLGMLMKILVGLLLVIVLTQSMLLSVFGVNTTAVVYQTGRKEYTSDDDQYDQTRFELGYRYTVAGETYEGSDTMYFVNGYVTQTGADGKPVPKTAVVRYLPSVPRWSRIVSVPGGKRGSNPMNEPFGWLGVVLLILMLAVVRIRRRARKRMG